MTHRARRTVRITIRSSPAVRPLGGLTLPVPAAVSDRFHGEYGDYGQAGAGRDDDIVALSCAKGGAQYRHGPATMPTS